MYYFIISIRIKVWGGDTLKQRVIVVLLIIFSITYLTEGPLYAKAARLHLPRRTRLYLLNEPDTTASETDLRMKMKKGRPPLTAGKVAGEFLGGTAGGVLSCLVAFAAISANLPDGDGLENVGIAVGAGFMTLSAFPLGNSLGIYLAGIDSEVTGSYWMTMTGSLVGSLGAAGVLWWLEVRPESWWAPVILPTAGGIIGFNLTRRYRDSPAEHTEKTSMRYRQPGPGGYPGLPQYQRGETHYLNIVDIRF